MLSIGGLGFGQEDYYLRTVARGAEEYYVGHGEAPGRWMGRLSAELGLDGTVAAETLRVVLEGRDPSNGYRLGRNRKHRTPGFDLTFNAPKSVSVLWALSDPSVSRQVRDAHDTAVRAALEFLERDACRTRRGRNGIRIVSGAGFVAAGFRHRTSRNGDPQLHTHVLVANVTRADDGSWFALDGRHLYLWAKTTGYLYEAHLRAELTARLGLAWQPVRNGIADVEGVPDVLVKRFATRRDEIKAEQAIAGHESARAAQYAALKTRRAKDGEIDIVALHARWRDQAVDVGVDPLDLHSALHRAHPEPLSAEQVAVIQHELLGPDGLTKQASTFDRLDIIRAWCDRLPAGASIDTVERLADHTLATFEIVPLQDLEAGRGVTMRHQATGKPMSTPTTGTRYSTQDLLDLEARLVERAVARQHAGLGIASEAAVLDALAARPGLSSEQAELVVALTTSGHAVDLVMAPAGTGKTFSLDAARDAWQVSGHTVIGAALAARAAAELQATAGIPSDTIARLVRDLDHAPLAPRTVLVIDEASMAGTRRLARLLDHAHAAQAKVVLVGDPSQLPAIDAGGLLRGLGNRVPVMRLVENRRQHPSWERDALLKLRHGDSDAALAAYREHERISTHSTAIDAREHLVADWYAATLTGERVLMLAMRNRDVDDLNGRARAYLEVDGRLTGPVLHVDDAPYQAGDRIMTLRNNRKLHIRNGNLATIENVDLATRTMHIRSDDGGTVTLPASYLNAGHVRHAYAMTVHKAQGQTADRALVLGSDLLYQEAGYVALSRGRVDNRLYVVEPRPRDDAHAPERVREPFDALTHALATSHAQHLALDAGIDTDAIRATLRELVRERRVLDQLQQQCPADHAHEIHALEGKRKEVATAVAATQLELDELSSRPRWRDRSERNQRRVVLQHRLHHDAINLQSIEKALAAARQGHAERDAYLAEHDDALRRQARVLDEIERRLTQLAHADALAPPSFLHVLGDPPEDRDDTTQWHRAAVHVERYRAEHDITEPDHPFGPRPSGERGHVWQLQMERLHELAGRTPATTRDLSPPLGRGIDLQ